MPRPSSVRPDADGRGQFDLGPAAAFSLVYFLIILLVSWLFYTAMTHSDANR
jgi:glycerol transport system permease protein